MFWRNTRQRKNRSSYFLHSPLPIGATRRQAAEQDLLPCVLVLTVYIRFKWYPRDCATYPAMNELKIRQSRECYEIWDFDDQLTHSMEKRLNCSEGDLFEKNLRVSMLIPRACPQSLMTQRCQTRAINIYSRTCSQILFASNERINI
jgi:hypothetical protein